MTKLKDLHLFKRETWLNVEEANHNRYALVLEHPYYILLSPCSCLLVRKSGYPDGCYYDEGVPVLQDYNEIEKLHKMVKEIAEKNYRDEQRKRLSRNLKELGFNVVYDKPKSCWWEK